MWQTFTVRVIHINRIVKIQKEVSVKPNAVSTKTVLKEYMSQNV